MANTVTLGILSASTDGQLIKVAATSSPGTSIHTTGTNIDAVYLLAYNAYSADVTLTIEWGGTTADDRFSQLIEFQKGDIYVVLGKPLKNGKTIRAYASVADVILISGWVHTITPGA